MKDAILQLVERFNPQSIDAYDTALKEIIQRLCLLGLWRAKFRSVCPTDPLTLETHERGLLVAERYRLGIYDSLIIAAALIGNCGILYSEDMQDGLLIDQQVRIFNPFTSF